jgi:hypothetical protein
MLVFTSSSFTHKCSSRQLVAVVRGTSKTSSMKTMVLAYDGLILGAGVRVVEQEIGKSDRD